MTERTRQALLVLREGGYFRKQLESAFHGGEKFATRLRNARGETVKGVGFQTFTVLESEGMLKHRPCASSSVWPEEWVLNVCGGCGDVLRKSVGFECSC